MNRRDQLSIDRGEGRTGDIPALESATDDHTDGVGVEALDLGGGLDDAASDDAELPLDQFGGAETVSENVVVQARNSAKRIDRDGTDFAENVSPRRASSRVHHALSLCSLTPARTRADHLGDGVGSDGGKCICDRAGGKFPNGPRHSLSQSVVFLCHDADVSVLVEHLVDGNEVLIGIIIPASVQNVSLTWYTTAKSMYPILS